MLPLQAHKVRAKRKAPPDQHLAQGTFVYAASATVLGLAACNGSDGGNQTSGGAEVAENSVGASEDLIKAAQEEGTLVVYGSCEEDYLAAACNHFQEVFGIEVQYQRLSTGEVQAKIEEENGNPSGDVWFGGTTDPYNVVTAEGLLEPYEAANASPITDPKYQDADGNWYGIYTGLLGIMYNKDEVERLGVTPARGLRRPHRPTVQGPHLVVQLQHGWLSPSSSSTR